jgi:hypothetical protein
MVKQPFSPQYGATVTIATAAGAANANVAAQPKNLLIYNDATGPVFVRVKPSGVVSDATIADMPVPSKGTRVISKDPQSQNIVSVFSPGGALGNVYACPGDGYGSL